MLWDMCVCLLYVLLYVFDKGVQLVMLRQPLFKAQMLLIGKPKESAPCGKHSGPQCFRLFVVGFFFSHTTACRIRSLLNKIHVKKADGNSSQQCQSCTTIHTSVDVVIGYKKSLHVGYGCLKIYATNMVPLQHISGCQIGHVTQFAVTRLQNATLQSITSPRSELK